MARFFLGGEPCGEIDSFVPLAVMAAGIGAYCSWDAWHSVIASVLAGAVAAAAVPILYLAAFCIVSLLCTGHLPEGGRRSGAES